MTEAEYFGDWYKCIDKVALAKVKKQLDILYKTKLICPHYIDVFKAFKLCDYNNLSVVMLGMEPYAQKDVATGLAFANKDKVESPSLKVIQDTLGYNINPTLEKSIRSYCEFNGIEDVNAFANRCAMQGFNIVKFGA